MKEPAEENEVKSGGPSGWAMASQLGMMLVSYVCLFGFGGYFIGDRLLNGRYWAVGLMVLGIVGGFSAALYQIIKMSNKLDKAIPNRGKPLEDETEEKSKFL